jgi:prophage antirepressor-like protein
MNPSALSAAVLQRGGLYPTICGCCHQLFHARSVLAVWCSDACRRRAGYYRRSGRPIPVKGSKWTQPIRPQVVQPEILPAAPAASALAPFAYGRHQVRVITDEHGEPWFVAADVCAALAIANARDALTRLDDDEKGVASTDTLGGRQSLSTVNEFGLYSLILGSRKPEARAFKRWVTHEVLPSIRRTGSYSTRAASAQPTLPEGIHVVAATQRRAAELWWEAIESEVHGALARRLNPRHRTDDGLPRGYGYQWQQLSLIGR